jgi:CTP synthase (UTP-ammonia lyase)
MRALQIGLIGDFNESVTAHRAIPLALQLAAGHFSQPLELEWLATDQIPEANRLAGFDALWCVPASPYRSMDGALRAIRFARENGVPFLGTCGGFQHAVIEVARNVLGWHDAEHAETAPESAQAVISALTCALVEVSADVSLRPGSHIAAAYGAEHASEGYRCNYGLNPAFAERLTQGPLRATAHDAHGEVRAVELDGHPFFVCTLFQPERAALRGTLPPLVAAWLRTARALTMTPPDPGV